MASRQGQGGAREQDAERRLLPLLLGQKQVFELMARGAPLLQVLDALVRLIEPQLTPGARASILLPDGTEIGGEPGLETSSSLPVTGSDGAVLGTFALYASEPGPPAEADLTVLQAFAQTAALAIERDHDLTTILREKRTAEALNRVGKAIAARLELGEIVQQATDAATELTHAAFGAFFYNVVGDDGEAYQLYTLSGAPREAFERFPMPRATAIFAPTFNGEAPVRLDDVLADPRFGQSPPYNGMPPGHLPVRSYLAVPVKTSEGDVAGGLFFGHPEPGVFDDEAERLAVGIAAHAAIAIENARLFASAQRAFEDRDRVARTLQASLLPPSIPDVPGLDIATDYHAAGSGVDVLGDFYDVFSHGPGRWAIVIGDVCGKGIHAAKVTALARHTVRAVAMHADSPSEVLRSLNDATLSQADGSGLFLTAIYADVDLRGPKPLVRLCCAGHPPALVVKADGTVVTTGHHGPLLGAFESVVLTDEHHELEPGDALVLVTDGVIEARAGGALFGEPRLHEVLMRAAGGDAEALVSAITEAVVDHAGEQFVDDVAIVALRVPEATTLTAVAAA